ncbi:MAG: DNA-3-methyladenine glycosylase I [Limisphaerales bacterium]
MQNRRKQHEGSSRQDDISDAMSKDLLKRGFKFIGSTICYAYMQAVGMVNDHHVTCFRHKELFSNGRVERPVRQNSRKKFLHKETKGTKDPWLTSLASVQFRFVLKWAKRLLCPTIKK